MQGKNLVVVQIFSNGTFNKIRMQAKYSIFEKGDLVNGAKPKVSNEVVIKFCLHIVCSFQIKALHRKWRGMKRNRHTI